MLLIISLQSHRHVPTLLETTDSRLSVVSLSMAKFKT